MKRLSLLLVLLVMASAVYAGSNTDGSLTFGIDSKQIVIGPATVTQIMTKDSFVTSNKIVNQSTWTSVCISTFAASILVSSNTSPSIPPNTVFSPDGPYASWQGALWGTACLGPGQVVASSQTISVIRTK